MAIQHAAPFFISLLLISVTGCTHLTPSAPFPSATQCPPAPVLRDLLHMPVSPVVKAIAKISVESPGRTFSVKELVLAAQPNRLRLETLSPLGQPGFYAATDGRELFLYDPSEHTFYRGDATPGNVGRLIPVKMELEDLVAVIRGGIPGIENDDDHFRCAAHEEGYILTLNAQDKNTTRLLTLSRDDLRVVSSATYEHNTLTRSITYADYALVGKLAFPRKITLSLPTEQTTVTLHYKKVELLEEIDATLFQLVPPPGATVVLLE